jgi:hypothetical protein
MVAESFAQNGFANGIDAPPAQEDRQQNQRKSGIVFLERSRFSPHHL